ncbi:MAG TPA: biotin/lipoyl-binding protein, partial [Acetobacteraceae bacterium]|nr:biotin/lipoyl-binding protein [Acetobacteraceae bacterium]
MIGVIVAIIYALWLRYQVEPLTRDGKVRADIVPVAADVGGLVTDILVHDNQQVKQGQVMLVIDRPRYQLALAQAEANLSNARVALSEAILEDRRNRAMPDVVARETTEQGTARVGQLRAAVQQAIVARDLAAFNLQ